MQNTLSAGKILMLKFQHLDAKRNGSIKVFKNTLSLVTLNFENDEQHCFQWSWFFWAFLIFYRETCITSLSRRCTFIFFLGYWFNIPSCTEGTQLRHFNTYDACLEDLLFTWWVCHMNYRKEINLQVFWNKSETSSSVNILIFNC